MMNSGLYIYITFGSMVEFQFVVLVVLWFTVIIAVYIFVEMGVAGSQPIYNSIRLKLKYNAKTKELSSKTGTICINYKY